MTRALLGLLALAASLEALAASPHALEAQYAAAIRALHCARSLRDLTIVHSMALTELLDREIAARLEGHANYRALEGVSLDDLLSLARLVAPAAATRVIEGSVCDAAA